MNKQQGSSARVRAWVVRAVRRGSWALAACLAGLGLVTGWAMDEFEANVQLRQKVQALQEETRVASPPAEGVSTDREVHASDGPALMARLPAVRDAPALWLVLQKGLQQQGLQLEALRPQALQEVGPLPTQAVAVRMQGRYADMASAWASLTDAGPVWSLDRLSASTSGSTGQLQWDGVWRVWLRPGPASGEAWPAHWHAAARREWVDIADPFMAETGRTARASEPTLLSADPRRWPLAQTRLLGVWQQDGRWQAVLAAGPHWAVLGPGASVAQEGYHIQTIHPDAVSLQARQAPGEVHILRLQEVTP